MPGLPQQPGAWRDLAGLACILLAQSPDARNVKGTLRITERSEERSERLSENVIGTRNSGLVT